MLQYIFQVNRHPSFDALAGELKESPLISTILKDYFRKARNTKLENQIDKSTFMGTIALEASSKGSLFWNALIMSICISHYWRFEGEENSAARLHDVILDVFKLKKNAYIIFITFPR